MVTRAILFVDQKEHPAVSESRFGYWRAPSPARAGVCPKREQRFPIASSWVGWSCGKLPTCDSRALPPYHDLGPYSISC